MSAAFRAGDFSLGRFLILSLLWHAGQLLLFSTILQVRPPLVEEHAQPGTRTILQYQTATREAGTAESAHASRSVPDPARRPMADPQPQHAESAQAPALNVSVAKKQLRLQPNGSTPATLDMPASPATATPSAMPFSFSTALKARRVIRKPDLPSYPDSARRMGTDLCLVLKLRVSAAGEVLLVDVRKSSGDSITDDTARTYAGQLLFEPASRVDEGEMIWEFRLQ